MTLIPLAFALMMGCAPSMECADEQIAKNGDDTIGFCIKQSGVVVLADPLYGDTDTIAYGMIYSSDEAFIADDFDYWAYMFPLDEGWAWNAEDNVLGGYAQVEYTLYLFEETSDGSTSVVYGEFTYYIE